MQFTVTINQAKALEWGVNSQQALLFAFVFECPSWAKMVETGLGDFYALSVETIIGDPLSSSWACLAPWFRPRICNAQPAMLPTRRCPARCSA